MTRLRERFGTKAIAIAAVVVLLAAGVAAAATGILPEPAQNALAGAAERIADIYGGSDDRETTELTNSEGDIGHPMDNGKGVPQAVKNHHAELRVWIACIQDGARERAQQQSDPDTRAEDDGYSREKKEARCGSKPTNPHDDAEEDIEDEGRPENAGPPPWAGGPPPWAGGPPPWAGGPPPWARGADDSGSDG